MSPLPPGQPVRLAHAKADDGNGEAQGSEQGSADHWSLQQRLFATGPVLRSEPIRLQPTINRILRKSKEKLVSIDGLAEIDAAVERRAAAFLTPSSRRVPRRLASIEPYLLRQLHRSPARGPEPPASGATAATPAAAATCKARRLSTVHEHLEEYVDGEDEEDRSDDSDHDDGGKKNVDNRKVSKRDRAASARRRSRRPRRSRNSRPPVPNVASVQPRALRPSTAASIPGRGSRSDNTARRMALTPLPAHRQPPPRPASALLLQQASAATFLTALPDTPTVPELASFQPSVPVRTQTTIAAVRRRRASITAIPAAAAVSHVSLAVMNPHVPWLAPLDVLPAHPVPSAASTSSAATSPSGDGSGVSNDRPLSASSHSMHQVAPLDLQDLIAFRDVARDTRVIVPRDTRDLGVHPSLAKYHPYSQAAEVKKVLERMTASPSGRSSGPLAVHGAVADGDDAENRGRDNSSASSDAGDGFTRNTRLVMPDNAVVLSSSSVFAAVDPAEASNAADQQVGTVSRRSSAVRLFDAALPSRRTGTGYSLHRGSSSSLLRTRLPSQSMATLLRQGKAPLHHQRTASLPSLQQRSATPGVGRVADTFLEELDRRKQHRASDKNREALWHAAMTMRSQQMAQQATVRETSPEGNTDGTDVQDDPLSQARSDADVIRALECYEQGQPDDPIHFIVWCLMTENLYDFVYLGHVDASERSGYALRVIPQSQINPSMYWTLSLSGLTRVQRDEIHFTALGTWLRERSAFISSRRLRFFVHFRMLKAFVRWRSLIQGRRFRFGRAMLAGTWLPIQPVIHSLLLQDVRPLMLSRLASVQLVAGAARDAPPITLQKLCTLQRHHLKQRIAALTRVMNTELPELVEASIRRMAALLPDYDACRLGATRRDQEGMRRLRDTYRVVRMIDYMSISQMLQLYVEAARKLLLTITGGQQQQAESQRDATTPQHAQCVVVTRAGDLPRRSPRSAYRSATHLGSFTTGTGQSTGGSDDVNDEVAADRLSSLLTMGNWRAPGSVSATTMSPNTLTPRGMLSSEPRRRSSIVPSGRRASVFVRAVQRAVAPLAMLQPVSPRLAALKLPPGRSRANSHVSTISFTSLQSIRCDEFTKAFRTQEPVFADHAAPAACLLLKVSIDTNNVLTATPTCAELVRTFSSILLSVSDGLASISRLSNLRTISMLVERYATHAQLAAFGNLPSIRDLIQDSDAAALCHLELVHAINITFTAVNAYLDCLSGFIASCHDFSRTGLVPACAAAAGAIRSRQPAPLSMFVSLLKLCEQQERAVDSLNDREFVGCFEIDRSAVRGVLMQRINEPRRRALTLMPSLAAQQVTQVLDDVGALLRLLETRAHTLDHAVAWIRQYDLACEQHHALEQRYLRVRDWYNALTRYGARVPVADSDAYEALQRAWRSMLDLMATGRERRCLLFDDHRAALNARIHALQHQEIPHVVSRIRCEAAYAATGLPHPPHASKAMSLSVSIPAALRHLRSIELSVAGVCDRVATLKQQQQLFDGTGGYASTDSDEADVPFPELDAAIAELRAKQRLWRTWKQWEQQYQRWCEAPMRLLDVAEVATAVDQATVEMGIARCTHESIASCTVYTALDMRLGSVMDALPALQILLTPFWRDAHRAAAISQINLPDDVYDARVDELLGARDLSSTAALDALRDCERHAWADTVVLRRIARIADTWEVRGILPVLPWEHDATVWVLGDVEAMTSLLREDIDALDIISNDASDAVRRDALLWQSKLRQMLCVIELWDQAQGRWYDLASAFSTSLQPLASPRQAHHAPVPAARHVSVDLTRTWRSRARVWDVLLHKVQMFPQLTEVMKMPALQQQLRTVIHHFASLADAVAAEQATAAKRQQRRSSFAGAVKRAGTMAMLMRRGSTNNTPTRLPPSRGALAKLAGINSINVPPS